MNRRSGNRRNDRVYASTGESAEWMVVPPEMAKEWLLLNTQNRRPKPKAIDTLRLDIREGRWVQDGTPIRWGENGLLMDAQHRLMAQVAEGYTIEYLVVWDLKQEAMDVIDSGAKRSVGDTLGLEGVKHAVQAASVAKVIMSLDNLPRKEEDRQPRTINQGVSKSEVLAYVREHPEISEACTTLSQFKKAMDPFIPSSYIAAYLHMAEVDEQDAFRFFDLLSHPEIGITDVAGVYRLYKTKDAQHVTLSADTKHRNMIQVGLIWRAWNDYRKNVNPTSIQAYRLKIRDQYIALPARLY